MVAEAIARRDEDLQLLVAPLGGLLASEGDSQVRWFEGNFSEYEAFRKKELGAEADQPHRIKYKPLAR